MIKEVIYKCYNKATESGFNIINENALTQKVKELSENIIFSIGSQTLIGSLALKVCGISFGTSFPILLALIVAKSFLATLNHVKTVVKKTLNGAKAVIQITAQKAASPFMQVATVINAIFKRVCASFMSFALSSYDLIRNISYLANLRGFNDRPSSITLPAIDAELNPMVEDKEELAEEVPSPEDLAPSKPRLPFCDSQFVIQEKDSKEGSLLRGIPERLFLDQNLEQALGAPMRLLLKEDNTPWMFFLEHNPERPLKELTSQRLGTTITALSNLPAHLLFEGVPVSFRSMI